MTTAIGTATRLVMRDRGGDADLESARFLFSLPGRQGGPLVRNIDRADPIEVLAPHDEAAKAAKTARSRPVER